MIVAVVDICLIVRSETLLKIIKSCGRVNTQGLALAMQLKTDASFSFDTEGAIQQIEPEDECIITREGAKRDSLVGRAEAEDFKGFLSRYWSLGADTEGRVQIVPATSERGDTA